MPKALTVDKTRPLKPFMRSNRQTALFVQIGSLNKQNNKKQILKLKKIPLKQIPLIYIGQKKVTIQSLFMSVFH